MQRNIFFLGESEKTIILMSMELLQNVKKRGTVVKEQENMKTRILDWNWKFLGKYNIFLF